MAYAGTGDVLKIQQMLAIAGEHIEVEEGEAWKVMLKLSSTEIVMMRDHTKLHLADRTECTPLWSGRACDQVLESGQTGLSNTCQALLRPATTSTLAESSLQVAHQSPAVFGLALVAMAEDLGSGMALRTLEHLLQYGEPPVRSDSQNPS